MTLLQPSYLLGLLALAIPIAIHLWSRKKVRTIKVGSTQFIAATKSKESNSLQLNEWWLLVLRCLIISTLVIILAEPHITKAPDKVEVSYIFEPSLLSTADGLARFEQIPLEGRRLLRDDFPLWENGDVIENQDEVPHYWQLAREMEHIPADSIVVFTHAFAKAVQGKRPTIRKNITWIAVDVTTETTEPVVAIENKDSLEIFTVRSSSRSLAVTKTTLSKKDASINATNDSLAIETENGSKSIAINRQFPLQVTIVYNKNLDTQRVYLEAALRAIAIYTEKEIQINAIEDTENTAFSESDYVIMLDDQAVSYNETPILLYRPDALSQRLIAPGPTMNTSLLTKKLTPNTLIENHLVEQLLEWMQLDQAIVDNIDAFDKRTLPINQLQTRNAAIVDTGNKIASSDMSGILWLVLFVFLVGERILSRIRKQ